MSATTALELVALLVGVVALVVWVRRVGLRISPWDALIGEHLDETGDYPTVAQLRSGRIGRDARPTPAGPATVTVTAVDGKPLGGAR